MAEELPPEQIRRVLVVAAMVDNSEIAWHLDDGKKLRFSANCSDLFEWGTADGEPIESDDDVDLLETCLVDLFAVGASMSPLGPSDLYSARRRRRRIMRMFLDPENAYYPGDTVAELFRQAASG